MTASRRDVLIGSAALGLSAALPGTLCAAPFDGAAWRRYAERFLLPEGRIVDTGNKGISHSEGQGYGMLLAVAAGDRAAFDRLWGWTQRVLIVRGDGLAAWRWTPDGGVADRNNASDGDMLIAWALLRAAETWQAEAYRTAGTAIVRALASGLLVEQAGLTVLLPGRDGFRKGETLILNPSYWIFPAIRAFAALADGERWGKLSDAGLVLLFLWLGTAHVSAWRNENLLLLNPLCLAVIPAAARFLRAKPRFTRRAAILGSIVALMAAFALFSKILPWFAQANLHWILLFLPMHLAVALSLQRRSDVTRE